MDRRHLFGISTNGTGLTQFPLPAGTDPEGITVGPDGNIWFVDYGTSMVDKITLGGSITTFALGGQPAREDHDRLRRQPLGHRVVRRPDRAVTTGGSITEFAVPTARRPLGDRGRP